MGEMFMCVRGRGYVMQFCRCFVCLIVSTALILFVVISAKSLARSRFCRVYHFVLYMEIIVGLWARLTQCSRGI